MKKLIINGDDFGYSRGVNFGIIDAYQCGMLTSATILSNMPGACHAYDLASIHPGLGVGVHLNLTLGTPIRSDLSSLTQDDGTFHPRSYYQEGGEVDLEEVLAEWTCQIEEVIKGGIHPTHLDSHHHIHSYPGITDIFLRVAEKFQLPTRVYDPLQQPTSPGRRTPDLFIEDIRELQRSPHELADYVGEAGVIEVMTHPAYLDKPLMDQSSLLYPRLEDFAHLTDETRKKTLEDSGLFAFTTYRCLTE
ncbi:carbohydrate deacetylase [Alteribacillus iranensis]|uniref:Carbohydrate deacetylase n=1 Tax=Alteribacillus iranensis TaxID=930128 RepID=A0A1I2BPA0_9BACI|nr:carbohydrate deacetylase [Alteribacillus iranensis]SFE57678.1 hypothetical protein SAMN05192532_102418 [Alteribacillus iranensis]